MREHRDHGRCHTQSQEGIIQDSLPRSPARRPWSGLTLFGRSREDRVIAGVAGGLGRHFGIDPILLRIAFCVLALAGGAGVVLYLALWALSRESSTESDEATGEPATGGLRQAIGVGLITLGLLLPLRSAGLWFGDAIVWPIAIGALGSAIIWARSDSEERARWARVAARLPGNPGELLLSGRVSPTRLVLGALLIVGGMAGFLAYNNALVAARNVGFAILVTVAGLVLVAGPGVARLLRSVGEERRERIRSEARADMAAHLHDSVLQTLALIQRSRDTKEMTSLARVQERELRAWLFGPGVDADGDTIGVATDAIANRIEEAHQLVVDTVVVGDGPLDDAARAVVAAAGEAATNAAKHSGDDHVSIYIEANADSISAYVRDQGKGFAPDAVPSDRRGIADSIVGRIERHGGSVTISTAPGEGTEVAIEVPRSNP